MTEIDDNEIFLKYETKEEPIGKGTFSTVKLGINKETKEKVAIKILEKKKILLKEDLERVKREINILKNFNNLNVIKVYEIYESKTRHYLIMEYCEKGELFNHIVENQKLENEEASYFYYQLINGLEYIHSKGVVHRDLKPENLLIGKGKILKIIDFGLSNYFNGKNLLVTPCGSPCYASPEMVSGKKYNGFCIDIWSTGIILYAMVCGYLPFEDPDNDVLFKKILKANLEFPDDLNDNVIDLINKILVTNPDKRIKINEIKQHPFYLQGKDIFQKMHPDLFISNNNNNDVNNVNIKIISNFDGSVNVNNDKSNPADIGVKDYGKNINRNNINNKNKDINNKNNIHINGNNFKREKNVMYKHKSVDNKKIHYNKPMVLKTENVVINHSKNNKYKNNNTNPNKSIKKNNNLKELKYISSIPTEKENKINKQSHTIEARKFSKTKRNNTHINNNNNNNNNNKLNLKTKRPYSKDSKIPSGKRINTEHDLFEKEYLNKIHPPTSRMKNIRSFTSKNKKKNNTFRTNYELFNTDLQKNPEKKKITQSNITNTNSNINSSNYSNNLKTENGIEKKIFNNRNKKNIFNIQNNNKKQNSLNDLSNKNSIKLNNLFNNDKLSSIINKKIKDLYKTERPKINNNSSSNSNSKSKNNFLFSNEFYNNIDLTNKKITRKTNSLRSFNSSHKKVFDKNNNNNSNKKSTISNYKNSKKNLALNYNLKSINYKEKSKPVFQNNDLFFKNQKRLNLSNKEILQSFGNFPAKKTNIVTLNSKKKIVYPVNNKNKLNNNKIKLF